MNLHENGLGAVKAETVMPRQEAVGLMAQVYRSERLEIACHALLVSLVLIQAATFHSLQFARKGDPNMDFLAFYVSGTMWREGRPEAAYDMASFTSALSEAGQVGALTWAYPPPMFLVGGLLSALPIWAAYLCFMLPGYVLFVAAIRRLAGSYSPGALALALPALIINARNGQTGVWIAAVQAWFVLAMMSRKCTSGPLLGVLSLKPHLGIGLGIAALAMRRFDVLFRAFLVVLALAVTATLALGDDIWPAFFAGSGKVSAMLMAGQFPLVRMSSVFAFARYSQAATPWALAAHLFALAVGIGVILWGVRRKLPERELWAGAVFAGLLVSPYAYDYDLVLLALAGALVLPMMCHTASNSVLAGLLVSCWLAALNFPLMLAQIFYWGYLAGPHGAVMLHSFSAPFLFLSALLCGWSLHHQRG